MLDCYERTIQRALIDSFAVKIVAIYPQPAEAGGLITIDLSTQLSTEHELVVSDVMGREQYRVTANMSAGYASLTLPRLGAGYYVMTLRSPASFVTRSLIVR